MTDSRTRFLMSVVAVLLGIRFVLLPWFDYQSGLKENLLVLTQRLERSSSVVENRAKIEDAELRIGQALNQLRPRFPEFPSVEPFQLDVQQKVNQAASARTVNLNVFAWVLDEPIGDGSVTRSRARMMAMGKIGDLAVFQADLETRFPSSRVVEANVISSGEMGSASAGTLNVVMDFYFRPAQASTVSQGSP